MLRLIARSARIFVGHEVCRNEEWLAASIHYTENVFMTATILRMFPSYLHPLVLPGDSLVLARALQHQDS